MPSSSQCKRQGQLRSKAAVSPDGVKVLLDLVRGWVFCASGQTLLFGGRTVIFRKSFPNDFPPLTSLQQTKLRSSRPSPFLAQPGSIGSRRLSESRSHCVLSLSWAPMPVLSPQAQYQYPPPDDNHWEIWYVCPTRSCLIYVDFPRGMDNGFEPRWALEASLLQDRRGIRVTRKPSSSSTNGDNTNSVRDGTVFQGCEF